MEQKLTNDEMTKVFSLYGIDAPILTIDGKGRIMTIHPKVLTVSLNSIMQGQNLHGIDKGNGGLHRTYLNKDDQCNLLLSPLSKITDEHKNDVCKITGRDAGMFKNEWIFRFTNNAKVLQYLISKGYAVPLWFGIDHWANGKTAIELGIAIENK
ncbi:MAG: hypothetical protein V4560_14910 [Bacteroidota bacterium]